MNLPAVISAARITYMPRSVGCRYICSKTLQCDKYMLCKLIYPGYVAFYTCYNCIPQEKALTALTELSAITGAFVSMT